MGDIEKDRKEIKRLIKKSEIKEVNGMDYSDELEQTLTLMAEHTPDKEKMDKYRMYHKELALTALGEQLSDIPMGRLIQFQNVFEKELDKFKGTYLEYRNGKTTVEAVVDEYERFCAVIEYFDNILKENSEDDKYEIPGLADEDVFTKCVTVDVDETDISKYYESLEYIFRCFECLARYARKIIDKNDKTLMSVLSFELGLHNVYTNGLIEFFREQNKNASDI